MAGHSHWAGIKHKKALIDSRRGKVWSKMSRAIIVAAKMGGPDPDANLRLRYAINDAKAISMPKDNIERAIAKGSGEAGGDNYEEVVYEGHGPAGVAFMVDILTDNRNRTAPEVRKIFEVCGGRLGVTGCAAWMFDRRGVFTLSAQQPAGDDGKPGRLLTEDDLMEVVLEAGADDVRDGGDAFQVLCAVDDFQAVGEALEAAGLAIDSRSLSYVTKDTVAISGDDARNALKLMERLDDHDDIQQVAVNFTVDEEELAKLEA
jgi:YebC/PmpR family DNA-binding regulatory protein